MIHGVPTGPNINVIEMNFILPRRPLVTSAAMPVYDTDHAEISPGGWGDATTHAHTHTTSHALPPFILTKFFQEIKEMFSQASQTKPYTDRLSARPHSWCARFGLTAHCACHGFVDRSETMKGIVNTEFERCGQHHA